MRYGWNDREMNGEEIVNSPTMRETCCLCNSPLDNEDDCSNPECEAHPSNILKISLELLKSKAEKNNG